jgi:hypothetical protein
MRSMLCDVQSLSKCRLTLLMQMICLPLPLLMLLVTLPPDAAVLAQQGASTTTGGSSSSRHKQGRSPEQWQWQGQGAW